MNSKPDQASLRKVTHVTHYDYQQPAECAQQICILQPQEGTGMLAGPLRKGQRVIHHSLRIQPNPSTVQSRTDAFGNVVHHFELNYPQDHLEVHSEMEVEVLPQLHPGAIEDLPGPAWNKLVEGIRYRAGSSIHADHQFRFESKHVPLSEPMRDYGMLDFWPNRPVVASAKALMNRIYREFTYKSGSTTIHTTVIEVMQRREGVCQDFAHLMLSVLRSLGLPARYVSGYMLTDPPPGQARLLGADASHAWVSLWCGEDLGWVDFDPTNNQLPDTRYVTVAVGRDYADVPPMRGVVHGGGKHKLKVAVTVL
ncbi:transglutaminase domain-containing protein [Limnobacter sp.]|uniref:transglutaminase family protein n=1 Tax=Limnobacter sp. TaxID=2003368 RepID=UPI003517B652